METRYDVEIYEYATGEAVSIIGKNMSEARAEKREMTGLSRCNPDYGCRMVKTK